MEWTFLFEIYRASGGGLKYLCVRGKEEDSIIAATNRDKEGWAMDVDTLSWPEVSSHQRFEQVSHPRSAERILDQPEQCLWQI